MRNSNRWTTHGRLPVALLSVLPAFFSFLCATCYQNSFALDGKRDLTGHHSNLLKTKVDKARSGVARNLKKYRENKAIAYLDRSHDLLLRSRNAINSTLRIASQEVIEIPETNIYEKTRAQVDKLEVITIRDNEMRFICNQLYEIGLLYVNADSGKAENCFTEIQETFKTYESRSCRKKAGQALEKLNRQREGLWTGKELQGLPAK